MYFTIFNKRAQKPHDTSPLRKIAIKKRENEGGGGGGCLFFFSYFILLSLSPPRLCLLCSIDTFMVSHDNKNKLITDCPEVDCPKNKMLKA